MLQPRLPPTRGRGRIRGATALFWLGVLAVLLQFVFPYVVLQSMGVNPETIRLHPATVLVMICGTYALLAGPVPFHQLCREAPGVVLFVFAIPVLNAYSVYFTGISGAGQYVETYLSAGLLALMLSPARPAQKRLLAQILITLCVINVFIALYESFTTTNWFALVIDPDLKMTDMDIDFRANAFYNHPLTASLITSMAIFLLFAMRMRLVVRAPVLVIFMIGLLAFGGRTALGVTLLACVLMATYVLLAGIINRNLKLEFAVAIGIAAIMIPILIGVIVTQTSMADRIIDTLYFDDSAEARMTQWEVFGHLTLNNWLFGISHDDLSLIKYQIGLDGKETDIEKFWFLMMLNLGAIGFSAFLAVFGTFLFHIARYSGSIYGRLLVLASLVIDSGSNSLGVKTADLFCEVAFLVAMSGYAGYAPNPSIVPVRTRSELPGPPRPQSALASVAPAKSRELRTLGSRAV
jgi:hypothetical protein